MAARVFLPWVLVVVFGLPGCAANQQAAGEVVAGTGVAAALVGLAIAAGCEEHEDWDEPGVKQCEGGRDANPNVGLPVTMVGLGVAIVGASIYAAAPDPARSSPSSSSSARPLSGPSPSPPPPRRSLPPKSTPTPYLY